MADQWGAFIWYELMTTDPEGAKAFYDAVVGWNVGSNEGSAMDYRMIQRADGGHAGGMLVLTEAMTSSGARPTWLGYVAVPDVDAAVASFEAAGGQVHSPAVDMPGVGRIAMVADPQGAAIYLMKPTPPSDNSDAVSDVFSVDKAGHVRWNELAASDPAAAIGFLEQQFGWRKDGEMSMGDLGAYEFIRHDDTMIGAVMPLMPDMTHAAWSFYFGVEDIDRAAETIRSAGGTITAEPMQIPGGEYSLSAIDPQGASFGLVGPRKA